METILVVKHAPAPGGRYVSDGLFSGEWFREEVLRPAVSHAIESGEKVRVDLDGAPGYGSSFLEEAFGGLVRKGYLKREQVSRVLEIVVANALYAPYKALAEKYIQQALRESVNA
jgi:hypothetical protein